LALQASDQQKQPLAMQICSLREAMNMPHGDVLDYFATYAAKDASVVSVTYN
jgi:hypothetical protein